MKSLFDRSALEKGTPARIDHIHIVCKDLEKAVEFYKTMFGAREIERLSVLEAPTIRLEISGVIINLRGIAPGERQIYTTLGLSHYGIEVRDMEEICTSLKAEGVLFIDGPREIRPGVKIAFFQGPAGELIELLEKKAIPRP